MDLSNPLRSLARPLQAEVLKTLSATTGSLSGRQVHLLSGAGSVEGVRGALLQLVDAGVVDVEQKPGVSLYRLNQDHLLSAPLLAALDARAELLRRVGRLVERWPLPLLHASSFGSAARSDGDAGSDVDLLLVPVDATDAGAAEWGSAVDDLCVAVERWSGNVAHVQTLTREQLHRMAAVDDPLLASWYAEGRVLTGTALEAVQAAA